MDLLLQPTLAGEIQTPMAVAEVEFVDPREPVAVSIGSASLSHNLNTYYRSYLGAVCKL